jgi:hypothetical protein
MARRHQIKVAVAAVSTAVLLVPLAAFAKHSAPIGDQPTQDNKVAVCHFNGHEGDGLVTGQGFGCEIAGGMILFVSENALGGHGIGG